MTTEGLLKGHTVLITGASRGIGKAISVGFVREGANVFLVARTKAGLAEVAEACKGAGGGSVELLEMDAGSKESVTAVAKAVEGKVSVLVNNAGIAKAFAANPLELDPDDSDEMLAVNLAAPMRLVALLAPGLAKKGNGVIINVSSVAGLDPKPHAIGYASSKWGMTGFSESIAEALKGRIRVVSIHPAFVATDMARGLGKVPYEEMISTEDIVEAALLPFRMTSKACPTRIVIQNTFAV